MYFRIWLTVRTLVAHENHAHILVVYVIPPLQFQNVWHTTLREHWNTKFYTYYNFCDFHSIACLTIATPLREPFSCFARMLVSFSVFFVGFSRTSFSFPLRLSKKSHLKGKFPKLHFVARAANTLNSRCETARRILRTTRISRSSQSSTHIMFLCQFFFLYKRGLSSVAEGEARKPYSEQKLLGHQRLSEL